MAKYSKKSDKGRCDTKITSWDGKKQGPSSKGKGFGSK